MIELEGRTHFAAPRELVWEMVLDPEVLARILPGCNKLDAVNENEFQGQMKIKIGPVDGVFRGTVALSDLQPLEGFHLVVNGRGPSGIVEGEGDVRLQDVQDGTEFIYAGQGQVSGRMASVGQRVMSSSGKAVIKQSLENLDKQVQSRVNPPPAATERAAAGDEQAAPAAEVPAATSQSQFMIGVAENMLEELLPDPQQRKLVIGLGVTAAVILALNWFADLVASKVAKRLEEKSRE